MCDGLNDDNYRARMRLAFRVGCLEVTLKMAGVPYPSEEETDRWQRESEEAMARAAAEQKESRPLDHG